MLVYLPVTIADGNSISYFYNAAGKKLQMKTYQGSTLQHTTDYVGGFVYVDGTLSFFGTPEGRVVKKGNAFEYEYAIADHQGNTRVVFTSATPEPQVSATDFESDPGDIHNFPDGGNLSSFALFNNTTGGTNPNCSTEDIMARWAWGKVSLFIRVIR